MRRRGISRYRSGAGFWYWIQHAGIQQATRREVLIQAVAAAALARGRVIWGTAGRTPIR